jgi:predicted transcriptional regulator of viral defense system
LKKDQFFGYNKTWITDYDKISCSDLEKTFVDCFYMPGYAAGIIEIAKALYSGRKKINEDRLVEYIRKFNKQAIAKRMGYVIENLNLFPNFIKEIKSGLSSSYIILDPSLPAKGKSYIKWKVYDNVGIENIIESLKT